MRIEPSNIAAPEVLELFSLHDDFIISFLGDKSIYYTRYTAKESLQAVWLALVENRPAGCVAYRAKAPGVGEVKRMFIREDFRGRGISKQLLATVEEHARQQGDRALYLDTNARLEPAVSIYLGAEFAEISRKGDYIELQKML